MLKFYRKAFVALSVVAWMSMPANVQAGGSWGGSFGGSSGGAYGGSAGGSSGGYAAAYASSGGASSGGASWGGPRVGFLARMMARHSVARHSVARHSGGSSGGSSGGYVANYGSSGGSVGASSGGSSGGPRIGPLRRLAAKIHARKAARRHGVHGGSTGGSSGGHVGYASYSSASSGGQVAYRAGGSTGGGSTGSGSTGGVSNAVYGYSPAPIQSAPLSSASYESPAVESSYESYDSYQPAPETIMDHGYQSGESIMDHGASIMNDSNAGVPYLNGIGRNLDVIRLGNSNPITVPDNGYGDASVAVSGNADRYESAKPAIDADSVMMTIKVPSDAVVTVNDRETESGGELRQFMSKGLKEGYVYTYVVKVEYELDGETKVDTKSVDLRPGDVEQIEFDVPAALRTGEQQEDHSVSNDDVITVVRLNVPADATVSLAGNQTTGSGTVRTFRTKQLKQGQQWDDYAVQVTADVQGQSVTKERTVNVQAGSVIELTFDFEDTIIAAR